MRRLPRWGVGVVLESSYAGLWQRPLRRLYSTFADGVPGFGLLLLRLVVASALLQRAGSTLRHATGVDATFAAIFSAAAAVLLIAGLWTPLTGMLVALAALCSLFLNPADTWFNVFVAAIAVALAMLGPGRKSLDARLFGWRRVELPPRKSSSNLTSL